MNVLTIFMLNSTSGSNLTTVILIIIMFIVLFIYSKNKQKQFNKKVVLEQGTIKPGQKILRTNGQIATMVETDNNCLVVDADNGERLTIQQEECFAIESILDGIKTKLTKRKFLTPQTMVIQFAGKEIKLSSPSALFNMFSWKFNATKIHSGVTLIFIASVVSIIMSVLQFFEKMQSGAIAIFQTDSTDVVFNIVIAIVYVMGFFFILKGLTDLAAMQQSTDNKSNLMKIRNGMICFLISCLASYSPVSADIISGIFGIIATIMMLIGFSRLKKSVDYSINIQSAFATLYASVIWLMVGSILDMAPLVGNLLGAIPTIIGYIMFLTGWSKLKNNTEGLL